MQQKLHIKKIFGYYWPHVKKYPKSGIFVFVMYGLGIAASEVATPLIYKNIIDTMTQHIANPLEATEILFPFFIFLGVTLVFFNIVYRIGDYVMVYNQSNILREVADDAFHKIHKHSYAFFGSNFTGALVTKSKRFIHSFETLHDKIVYDFFFGGFKLIAALVVLFWFVPIVGFFFLAWLAFYCFLIYLFVKKQIPKDLAEANADSNVTARYADAITNILNIKMFSARRREYKKFHQITGKQERVRRIAWNFHQFQKIFQGSLFAILELIVIFLSIKLWLRGDITVGTIALIQIYLGISFDVVWRMGNNLSESAKALADANEMVEIFETPIDIADVKNPQKCEISDGRICFDRVSFAYENSSKVFHDFILTIAPGERIGLVGHSGAGKTTITKLLLRFSDVTDGIIRIDGQDIRSIKQDELRAHISYVPQEPLLFHRTLRENIAYGNTTATEKEIVDAATKAHAHDFISALPHGYNTLVGERGIKLSGGERQRVAIARAILKNAPILILDEATSSLDSMSEKHIQAALEELMKNKTTIVIAHRLSTVQKMDRILVLESGVIVEEGTHEKLITQENGIYKDYWQQQTNSFLL